MSERHVALDTNVLVAVVSPWHIHHQASLQCLEQLENDRALLHIPTHALTEAYSVLTRLPQPHRVPPAIASQGLKMAFEHCRLAEMPQIDWGVIDGLARQRISGGKVYDVLIAESAVRAGADLLLTWNLRDLQFIAPSGLLVREP